MEEYAITRKCNSHQQVGQLQNLRERNSLKTKGI